MWLVANSICFAIPNSTLLKIPKKIEYIFNLHDVEIHWINECCLFGDVIKQITILYSNCMFVNPCLSIELNWVSKKVTFENKNEWYIFDFIHA